uniref:PROP1-like PPR domain-containing protein n=1 Tax=Tetradesmus obliquus TaxID=3088 RepID=A0A383VS54_TETOB|eukprot:jgi/Sobl393_1/15952/SZX78779.1
MRRSVTRALQQHLLRRHCSTAPQAVQQQAVQALHAAADQPSNSSTSSSSSSSTSSSSNTHAEHSIPEAAEQLWHAAAKQHYSQHPAQLPQQHQYHAAAMASDRSAAAAPQHGLQQLLREQDEAAQQQQHPRSHWQQQPGRQRDTVAQQHNQQPHYSAAATPSSSSSSSSLPASSLSSSAEGSGLAGEHSPFNDVLGLSSFEQQYQDTLQHLNVGNTRNLSQLAQLFDPAAVLAAPDKGQAILEALMFGAAKLGDLALQQQLLRCMEAAGLQLSSTGHSALLHSLAKAGRPGKALQWLQQSVPLHLLTSNMLRHLVQPLLQQGNVAAAEQALRWAAQRMQQPEQPSGDVSDAAAGGQQQQQLLRDDLQVLPCMRLAVAAAKGTLGAVQAEWDAIQQEQQQLLQQQRVGQQQAHAEAPGSDPPLLSVPLWCSYVSALGRVGKRDPAAVHSLMQEAVEQLADAYHSSAWASWVQAVDRSQRQQQQEPQQQWQLQAQQQALQAWQQVKQLHDPGWQDLNPAAVLPQQVAYAVNTVHRDRLRTALNAALHLANKQLDEAWTQRLLQLSALLKVSTREWGFDSLLNLRMWQGAPPEALEALLSELMGWGVTPSCVHYECLAESYALHQDVAAAEQVFDRMQAAGHTPLLRSYNRLLNGIAMYGDMVAATRIYARFKAQGLKPDEQMMRALFKCVRLYASRVRVETARKQALAKPGDTVVSAHLLSQRSKLFLAAYSQLATWQGELVAAGLKHSPTSMHQLLTALDRLGYVDDCLQLAKLNEEKTTGTFKAHQTALQAASRSRMVKNASNAVDLARRLAAGEALDRLGYTALIAGNFWISRDHQQMLDTVKAMVAAGHEPDESVLLQMLHVYCTSGMWGEALSVLDDVAAGRLGSITSSSSSSSSWQHDGRSNRDAEERRGLQQQPTAAAAPGGAGSGWRSRRYADDLSDSEDALQAGGSSEVRQQQREQLAHDKLWHVVLRKLWQARASDTLLNDFLSRMDPQQLQRFKFLYNLRLLPDGKYSMQPPEDWEVQPVPDGAEQQAGGEAAAVKQLAAEQQ